jgi:hypothetical protein
MEGYFEMPQKTDRKGKMFYIYPDHPVCLGCEKEVRKEFDYPKGSVSRLTILKQLSIFDDVKQEV